MRPPGKHGGRGRDRKVGLGALVAQDRTKSGLLDLGSGAWWKERLLEMQK
jgi:hypothetical protein